MTQDLVILCTLSAILVATLVLSRKIKRMESRNIAIRSELDKISKGAL